MARPQWQQVAPPNFAPVFAGLESANQMTNAGLNNLQKAITGFDNAQTAGANQEVLLRAMGFTDRDALQRAITDRTLFSGFTPNKISADTLGAIGNRQAALLSRATGEESLANTQYNNNRTRQGNAATDAFAPVAAAAYAAAGGYDPRLAEVVKGLAPQEMNTFFSNLQGLTSRDTSNKSGAFSYNTTVRNDQESRAADAAVAALERAGVDPATRGDLIRDANLNPTVEALVRSRSPGADLTGIGGGGSAPGTAGTRQGSAFDVTFGFTPTRQPITSMNIGDLTTMQAGMIKNQGASPLGAYQINKATLEEYAPKVLGENWRQQQFTPENQDKIAEAIYNDRRGGELHKTWAALPPAPAGVYANVPWSEMRDRIAEAEVGSPATAAQNLRTLPGQAQRYGTNAVNENIQAQGAVQVGSNPDRILRAAAENISKDEAIKRGESLPAGKVQVDRMLEQARSMGVPYAAALEIASNATVPTRWGSFVDAVTPFDSDSRKIDESKFMEGLRNYNAPNGTLAQADTANQLRQAQQSTVQAQQAVQTATANLLALQQAKARNPYIPDSAIERQQAALDLAQASLAAAGQRTEQINKQLMDITPVGTSSGQPRAVTAPSTEPRTLGRIEATGTSAANGGDPFRDLRRNQNRTANINILR